MKIVLLISFAQNTDAVDDQIQKVHQELTLSKEKISQLECKISERDKKIERLESDARNQRKRWLEESRTHSQTTNSLRAELEAKANNIAYLTTELHRLKQKNKNNTELQSEVGSPLGQSGPANVSYHPNTGPPSQPNYLHPDSSQPKKNQTHHHYVPAPPQRERSTLGPGSSASRIRRPGHRSTVNSATTIAPGKPLIAVHPSSADAMLGRQVNPLRHSAGNRSSGSESPDITPFLNPANEKELQLDIKQVLPPIPLSATVAPGTSAPSVLVHQVVSTKGQKKPGPSTTDAAIVTLAVNNAVPDNAWSLPQEHRSSEYN